MEFLRAEAQQAAEQFSDKKQVWIVDKDHGFAKAYVLEDQGDSIKVQKAQSNEVKLVWWVKAKNGYVFAQYWVFLRILI